MEREEIFVARRIVLLRGRAESEGRFVSARVTLRAVIDTLVYGVPRGASWIS